MTAMDPWERSQTIDPEVRAYVTSLVNAVGGSSSYDDTYAVGDDAIAVLKDLQRWLRLYDEKTNRLDVKRCLAEADLVKKDLLEILALWPDEAAHNKHKAKLALSCLELLVPLTWPLALEDEKATVNHHRHVPYLQLAQVGYKRAVLQYEFAKILRTVARVGLPAMALPSRERSRRDEGIIKLVLYFFRNIAMITQPQLLPSQGDENDVSRSATIEAFHDQDVFSVFLAVGSGMGDEFQEQDVVLLEILFHLLKGVDGRKLFMKKAHMATEENAELQNLLRKEKAMLNSYNKSAPTRHNRFGTMGWVKGYDDKMFTVSGQTAITDENSTLAKMDASKKWNKPKYRGKLAQDDEHSSFGARVDLTESARNHLRQFVEDFLDSSFNPLFASLRKAIEREADRVQDTMHHKQYFYLIHWFLNAEAARREQSRKDSTRDIDHPTQVVPEENTFAYIAAVLDQETFVLLNRQMQHAFDSKSWQDLQATLLCFTQILLTVQSMAESKDEEDQEIAENIQNRIFYEESTHDRIVQVLRGYTHQGFAYLDTVTECVHVFVRMLERYSKQNADLHIRSKRRARKKQKQRSDDNGGGEDPDDAAEDERDAHQAVSERKFDFARFSAKFLSQPCVDTFVALTHFYHDLAPAQLKRAHRFFYRCAFKHELTVLLFRSDILHLFHTMIKGPKGLSPAIDGFADWEQLVQYVFRRCFKWMERESDHEGWREVAVVEILFSKIPNTLFYLQNGYDKTVERRPPRAPAELEVRPSIPSDERVGIAVSILLNQAKNDDIEWVKKQLANAVLEREAWETTGTTRDEEPREAMVPPAIFVTADTDERKLALFKDKHLRLLLATLGVQRLGLAEDIEAAWVIPCELSAEQLKHSVQQIETAEFNPPSFDNGKNAEDFVRSKAGTRRGATFDDNDSDTDGAGSGGDLDDNMFPPNLPEKRKQRTNDDAEQPKKRRKRNAAQLTEEELEERRKARKDKDREKNAKIKSKLFITDSDDEDDEEQDAEFFRLEAERRRKMDGIIRTTLLNQMDNAKRGRSGAKGKKKHAARQKVENARKSLKSKRGALDSDDEDVSDDDDDAAQSPMAIADSDTSSSNPSDDEDADQAVQSEADQDAQGNKETPSTSPTPVQNASSPQPLKEVSANAVKATADDSEDEDEVPIVKPTARRRNARAIFVESDSDE